MDLTNVEPFDELMCTHAFQHEGKAVPEGAVGWVVKADPGSGTLDLIIATLWPSASLKSVPASNFARWSGRAPKAELMDYLDSAYRVLSEDEDDPARPIPGEEVGDALDRLG